jgi:GTPase SAR1 family protein
MNGRLDNQQKVERILTIMGSASVGKSALSIRLIESRFEPNYDPTLANSNYFLTLKKLFKHFF